MPNSKHRTGVDATQNSQSTLPEVIESLGTGFAQIRMALLTGPVWFADSAVFLLVSSINDAISREWNFSAAQRGMIVTMVYMGVLVGNLLSGPFSDLSGRRLPILVSFFFLFIFNTLSALCWGFFCLCFVRFLVGVAMGVGQPAQQALVSETTPTKWRIIISSIGMFLFASGEVYSSVLVLVDSPDMQDLHWRTLLIAGALPLVIFGLLSKAFLNESPLFLACGGRYEETRVVLESMQQDNRAWDVCIDFRPHQMPRKGSGVQNRFLQTLRIIFGPEHLVLTLILMMSCFTLNICFHGSLYAFPNVLAKGIDMGSSAAAALIYGGLLETAGYAGGVLCILYFRRIMVMKIYLASMATALTAFAWGASYHGDESFFFQFLAMYGYYASKFSIAIGFLIFFLYTSEVYPTPVRATGTAVVFAGGRVAAMLGAPIYELFLVVFGRFDIFFWMLAALCTINFWLTTFLTIETFGRVLVDVKDDPEEGALPGYGSVSMH
mmetsp:Transcript_76679/g.225086  ORF Transcript_76679/g.225086 Transcript_76679/m.225086 type:complete len:494 (+) Transcript_76679:107-1588(+)